MEAMKPPFEKQVEALKVPPATEAEGQADIIEEALLNRYAARHADVLRPLIGSRNR